MTGDNEWSAKMQAIHDSKDMQSFYDMLETMAIIYDMIDALADLQLRDHNLKDDMRILDVVDRHKSLRRHDLRKIRSNGDT